jgi:hypothetical protein
MAPRIFVSPPVPWVALNISESMVTFDSRGAQTLAIANAIVEHIITSRPAQPVTG